ncbi:MAG: glutamate-5-semialdehyde dehydrogenase [Clostridia bacterium]|nr:glutamate-5-semialdehyde dehydrogenase [Clostridia bacterium]
MEVFEYVKSVCTAANGAKSALAGASAKKKNAVLARIAELLRLESDTVIAANERDLANAGANGVPVPMLDRLKLDKKRIDGIADSLGQLIMLEDPIGSGTRTTRPNGLIIEHIRVPLGVAAIIYEARPNVTVDAAALCIKTGNACVLRGGKEAIETNRVLVSLMRRALADNDLPEDAVCLIDNTTRESSTALMKMRGLIDLLVPRGGAGLIRSVVDNATVPVIETGAGNCHIYIDKTADHELGVKVAINAKMSRPSVCNAIETMLIHEDEAAEFLPKFVAALEGKPLEIRGCDKTRAIIGCVAATDEDYATEYDDYILAVKVVSGIDEAIAHINKYNTGHSEAIITRDMANAARFRSEIDAAAVYVNASTRFTDGGEFGFGAELGISTQKLHARGPMGLDALTTGKYLITGEGQVR